MKSKKYNLGKILLKNILFLVLLILMDGAYATSFKQPQGLISEIIVNEEKVYFVQPDYSLSVLDLETGKVLSRQHKFSSWAQIHQTNYGLLVSDHDSYGLLEWGTANFKWKVKGQYTITKHGDFILRQNPEDKIQYIDLRTQGILWEYDGVDSVVFFVDGSKTVHHINIDSGTKRFVFLDINSGKELLRKEYDDLRIHSTYSYGEKIYSILIEKNTENSRIAKFNRIDVFDIKGSLEEEIDLTNVPIEGSNFSEWEPYNKNYYDSIKINDLVFSRSWGGMLGDVKSLIEWQNPEIHPPTREHVTKDHVVAGNTFVANLSQPASSINREIKLCSETDGCKLGYLGYMKYSNHYVVDSVFYKNNLLYGTNSGVLECYDFVENKTKWIYSFPVSWKFDIIRMAHRNYLVDDIVDYICQTMALYKTDGINLYDSNVRSKFNVIFDPNLVNIVIKAIIIIFLGLILGVVTVLHFNYCIKQQKISGILISIGCIMMLIELGYLFFLGRVFVVATVALLLSLLYLVYKQIVFCTTMFKTRKYRIAITLSLFVIVFICLSILLFKSAYLFC